MSGDTDTRKNNILMGRKCFLCQNTRYRSKHCRLFRFPARGTAMWNQWLTAMALSEEDIHPNEHPRVCQRHFDPKHFLTRQLSGMAVPMLHLKRIKLKQPCTIEEYSSNDTRETNVSENCATEYGKISDETKSVYEEVENVLLEEEESLQDLCSSLSSKEHSNEIEAKAAFRCSIPQHEVLEELLALERNRVERLLKINAQQKQVIEEQRNLLWELGVECVPDKLADDSE